MKKFLVTSREGLSVEVKARSTWHAVALLLEAHPSASAPYTTTFFKKEKV